MTAPDFPPGDIDAQAAWWFARTRSGDGAAANRVTFDAWLDTSPAHVAASDRYSSLWSALGDVRDDPRVLELRDNLRRSSGRSFQYAAAAAILTAIVSLSLWWSHVGHRPAKSPSGVDRPIATRFETGVGQVSRLALADGSTVILDTDSVLKAEFDGASRRISLQRGRAFFHVAHEKRPFTVTGRRLAVTATGTRFVVDLDNAADVVSMVEGSVVAAAVDGRRGQPVALKAGRSLTANNRGWQVGTVDAEHAGGWTTGELTFRNAPLADVVRETNRYSQRKILLGDPAVARARLSAVLKAGDIDTLVAAVQDLGIARISSRDVNGITLAHP